MKINRDFVVKKLTTFLRKANENWYQQEFLIPEPTNQYLAFRIADRQKDYNRLLKAKSLHKLLANIFASKELETLNAFVHIGGLVFKKEDFVFLGN